MLACLRFAFTKDSIFVQHKIMKPYNSTLGEFFRCTYDVNPVELDPSGVPQPTDNLVSILGRLQLLGYLLTPLVRCFRT